MNFYLVKTKCPEMSKDIAPIQLLPSFAPISTPLMFFVVFPRGSDNFIISNDLNVPDTHIITHQYNVTLFYTSPHLILRKFDICISVSITMNVLNYFRWFNRNYVELSTYFNLLGILMKRSL
jgi:hypothetical protein